MTRATRAAEKRHEDPKAPYDSDALDRKHEAGAHLSLALDSVRGARATADASALEHLVNVEGHIREALSRLVADE